MKLNKIHHVAVICSDYGASKDFYVRVLGLEVMQEVYREDRDSYKLDLSVNGEYQVELFSFTAAPPRPSYPEALGLRHLAFEVENVKEAAEELQAEGIDVEEIRIDQHTGKRFCFFADPDELPIELYERESI